MAELILGCKMPVPVTESEFASCYSSFFGCRLKKPLLLVVDCPAADILIANKFCLQLFTACSELHVVLVCEDNSYHSKKMVPGMEICAITQDVLAFTLEETEEYFRICGISCGDLSVIHGRTMGMILAVRLCAILCSNGIAIRSYELDRLFDAALISRIDRGSQLALLCATVEDFDERISALLKTDSLLVEYFGCEQLEHETILKNIRAINEIMPVISIDERRRRYSAYPPLAKAMERYVMDMPYDVRNSFLKCGAVYSEQRRDNYYAFLYYAGVKDFYTAAAVDIERPLMFNTLLETKEMLFNFALKCPLDCKPIIPRLVRVIALLMLTHYKERISFRFDEIIDYVSASSQYTEAERRRMLAYTHALRIYQDFYAIDRMGTHIKRAYDYFSGSVKFKPPFHSLTLYTPSVFALVRRYSVPLSTEMEQFVRYQRMYTEMVHHGAFVEQLYMAEAAYACGNLTLARERAVAVYESCTERYIAAKLIALTVLVCCSLLMGSYEDCVYFEKEISDAVRRNSYIEILEMGALCLAIIGCYKGGDAYVSRITCVSDAKILTNRYAAPFVYAVHCVALLGMGEHSELLMQKDRFLAVAEDVNNETIALRIKMCAAAAMFYTGDRQGAAEAIGEVIGVYDGSELIVPVSEICIYAPELFEFALEVLPEKHADYINKVIRKAEVFRRNIEAVRTRELTEAGEKMRGSDTITERLNSICDEIYRSANGDGLTRKALEYAVLAACGSSNDEIAQACGVTTDSVKSSLKRTYAKLGIRSRAQLKYVLQLERYDDLLKA